MKELANTEISLAPVISGLEDLHSKFNAEFLPLMRSQRTRNT